LDRYFPEIYNTSSLFLQEKIRIQAQNRRKIRRKRKQFFLDLTVISARKGNSWRVEFRTLPEKYWSRAGIFRENNGNQKKKLIPIHHWFYTMQNANPEKCRN